MADREGFEPSVTLLLHTLSKRAHSTTLTPALGGRDARNSVHRWQSLFEKFPNELLPSDFLDPGENPEEIGKAVEKQADHLRHRFSGFVQREYRTLGATGDGPGKIKACTGH